MMDFGVSKDDFGASRADTQRPRDSVRSVSKDLFLLRMIYFLFLLRMIDDLTLK